ncbi:MAG: 50S ribosomal protein L6 [Bacilli bacterium]|jgi:large subunit ribosomal protein L6
MSRIGKKPIVLPENVHVTVDGGTITVKGPKGSLTKTFDALVTVRQEGNELLVERPNDEKYSKQLHGTVRAIVANMVTGVTEGFVKQLEIKGIGFRAVMKGTSVQLNVGYSHPVIVDTLPNANIEVVSPSDIKISGTDKEAVGEIAARIRNVRRPEPYLGKGIAYKGERIRRKEGKKAGKK